MGKGCLSARHVTGAQPIVIIIIQSYFNMLKDGAFPVFYLKSSKFAKYLQILFLRQQFPWFATHWSHLGIFKLYWVHPTHSDRMGLECLLGIEVFKSSPSPVMLVCREAWEPPFYGEIPPLTPQKATHAADLESGMGSTP